MDRTDIANDQGVNAKLGPLTLYIHQRWPNVPLPLALKGLLALKIELGLKMD
jgi:hypothetical protein